MHKKKINDIVAGMVAATLARANGAATDNSVPALEEGEARTLVAIQLRKRHAEIVTKASGVADPNPATTDENDNPIVREAA